MQNLEIERQQTSFESADESDGRTRIVRAAYPLFVQQGYDSVSMQEIADAVPIHKATLYHHFQNKDDLFRAVVRAAMARLHAQIEGYIQEGGSAADQLSRVAAQIFRDAESELGRLMSDVNQHFTLEQRQQLVSTRADPWSLYQQIFRDAVASGELVEVDPALAAAMFVGMLHGQTWSLKIGRISAPLDEQRARYIVDVLFAGLNGVGELRS
jgi:TetR/AcrR family transcriptional regulator